MSSEPSWPESTICNDRRRPSLMVREYPELFQYCRSHVLGFSDDQEHTTARTSFLLQETREFLKGIRLVHACKLQVKCRADPRQESSKPGVCVGENPNGPRMTSLVKQPVQERGLPGAWLSGNDDECRPVDQPILQEIEGRLMFRTQVENSRIRHQRKRLRLQVIMCLVPGPQPTSVRNKSIARRVVNCLRPDLLSTPPRIGILPPMTASACSTSAEEVRPSSATSSNASI